MEDISVVMRKVIGVLLLTSFLTGCGTTYYADRSINTNVEYNTVNSVVDLVYNFGKATAYSVPKDYREEHERCIYMMLDNGNPGESCKWTKERAKGIVQVTMIRPNMCHELTSTLTYKNKTRSWMDTACLQNNKWVFYEQ